MSLADDHFSRVRAPLEPVSAFAPPAAALPWLTRLPRLSRQAPSVLVSAVIHMILVIVLGAWIVDAKTATDPLLLAASVGPARDEETSPLASLDEPVELAASAASELSEPIEMPKSELASAVFSPQLETPPDDWFTPAAAPSLPSAVGNPGAVLAGRDPRFRGQLLAREGGTTETEAAVTKGLAWIARHQNSDGSWSLDAFHHAGDCNGQCGNPGVKSDTAGTALALLPFLGSGQTHLRGEYNLTIARGLRWLIDQQKSDGDLRGVGGGTMYAHGQATIALCEAFALSQAELLKDPAQRAVNFIVAGQHSQGGWRYSPGQPGDLSVVGWQMMALRSAQMAYLEVPQETFLKANRFLNAVQVSPRLGQYCYMPGGHPTPIMTAEGLLCRQYSGWRHNHPVLNNGVEELLKTHLPKADNPYMYYWYYGTQVMHHMGGRAWQEWNGALRDLLVSMQSTTGHEAGSWAPGGGHDQQGGRLYMTALAVCTLEVYYRHMPLYKHSAAATDEPSATKASGRR